SPTAQGDEDALHSEIEHLDRLAADTNFVAKWFQLAVRREDALVRRRRNSLVPLHQLPAEILAMILLDSLDFEGGFGQKALQSLAEVSHRWWTIIKSQPRFWTCVGSLEDDIALNIRKAGTLPLQIISDTECRPPSGQEIVSLVRAHAHRWFKIRIQSDQMGDPLFQALAGYAFAGLEFLEINGFPHTVHLELRNIERLRQARLSLIPCVGHGRRQQTQPAQLLTSLSLVLSEHGKYPCACLSSFLRQCPNLRDLEICGLTADSNKARTSDLSSSLISLPSLRSLLIQNFSHRFVGTEFPLLSCLRCANLTTFTILYSMQQPGQVDPVAIVRQLCVPSQPEAEALPMDSVLRNIGEQVYFDILIHLGQVYIMAQNRGTSETSPMRFGFYVSPPTTEVFTRDILPHLTLLEIPIEIRITSYVEAGSWSKILDRFQNVTVLEFSGPTDLVQELIGALSQSSSSPYGVAPRVPRLEMLSIDDKYRNFWSANIDQMAPIVAVMLEKRRGLFKSAGMEWPSTFQVKALNSHIFNEGAWTPLKEDP
ncbi:hypothetical protein FRC01_011491, partial [Tulasnella sp. 417]